MRRYQQNYIRPVLPFRPDVPLATQHSGELLRALETIAAQMLRLDQREHDLVSFDAGNFKALRAQELRMAAETAAEKVRRSGVLICFGSCAPRKPSSGESHGPSR